MQLIRHRINTIDELKTVDSSHGVEIDIRSHGNELILHHDPFVDGQPMLEWLTYFNHGTLILNVKEEGLEEQIIRLMASKGIEDYFFLDQSFPFLIRTSNSGVRRSAVRVSDFEGLAAARALAGSIDWAWIDFFTDFPLSRDNNEELVKLGYKLCIVSPELHGKSAQTEIPSLRRRLTQLKIAPAAICTKHPALWV